MRDFLFYWGCSMNSYDNIEDKLCDIVTLLSLISNKVADIIEELPKLSQNYGVGLTKELNLINCSRNEITRNQDEI